MNDVFGMIMQGVRRGTNVRTMVQQMASRDPRVAQAHKIMSGKTEAELKMMCENICKERNIDLESFARSLGIQIPSNR